MRSASLFCVVHCGPEGSLVSSNPRSANGNFRRKMRARFKARGDPCSICRGRLGPIHYDEPSDAAHPLSFVIDEIKPISRWREFGYESPQAAARDLENLAPAHYVCNAKKSNKSAAAAPVRLSISLPDGEW